MKQELIKPIVAVLVSDTSLLDETTTTLEKHFGRCDFTGPWRSFTRTAYYEAEMGKGLERCILSFEKLMPAHESVQFKGWTAVVEERFTLQGKRQVNIDPGYVDTLKMVLVSGKCGGHKLCTAPNTFIDYLLWYNKGWQSFPWTFPDFRAGTYDEELVAIRKRFKEQAALTS